MVVLHPPDQIRVTWPRSFQASLGVFRVFKSTWGHDLTPVAVIPVLDDQGHWPAQGLVVPNPADDFNSKANKKAGLWPALLKYLASMTTIY